MDKGDSILCNMAASATAGFVSRLLFHPIDTLKSRIQASIQGFQYESIYACFKATIASTGIKGLYRGIGIALIGGLPGTCLYFTSYELLKLRLSKYEHLSSFSVYLSSGMLAEAVCCIIYVPVDVVKERLQVYQTVNISDGLYSNSLSTFQGIIRKEGFKGLYSGYMATLLSYGPFSAVYFLGYEKVN